MIFLSFLNLCFSSSPSLSPFGAGVHLFDSYIFLFCYYPLEYISIQIWEEIRIAKKGETQATMTFKKPRVKNLILPKRALKRRRKEQERQRERQQNPGMPPDEREEKTDCCVLKALNDFEKAIRSLQISSHVILSSLVPPTPAHESFIIC